MLIFKTELRIEFQFKKPLYRNVVSSAREQSICVFYMVWVGFDLKSDFIDLDLCSMVRQNNERVPIQIYQLQISSLDLDEIGQGNLIQTIYLQHIIYLDLDIEPRLINPEIDQKLTMFCRQSQNLDLCLSTVQSSQQSVLS